MTLGRHKLKALRKDRSYSQEEFAQILDVSRRAVSKWESDRGIPEIDKLIQISTIYGVTLDFLLKTDYMEETQLNNSYYVSREMIDALPVTALAIVIGIITNAWSPTLPIITLLGALLVAVCKLLLEGRGKNE